MSIVGRLTLRHLKQNKKRTLVTIFGVIVSVAMITAVTTSISSFLGMMGNMVGADEGDWVGYYTNTKAENIPMMEEYDNVDQVVACQDIGNYTVGGSIDESGMNMLSVRAQQNDSYDHVDARLTAGTYPKNAGEIMVRTSFLQQNGLDWKVGDTITLSQIQRYWTDESSSEQVRQYERYTADEQRAEHLGERQFKLVGTFNQYAAREYNGIVGLDAGALLPGDTVDLYTTQEKLSMTSGEQVKALGSKLTDRSDVLVHNDYLRYNGYFVDDGAVTVYGLSGIIMVIIMIASVTLIYNAFAISLNERSRYLGMLASVGATKRQKRNTVYYEGAFIGALGIPLGVLFGIAGIGVTFRIIGPLLESLITSSEVGLKLIVSPVGIVISVVLGLITILISAYIPGRSASRTTPIDAIRGAKQVTVSARRLKTSKLTRRLFGYEGELALKNIKRNRKKYRVIVGSLAISIILFLSVNSFTGLMTKSFSMANTMENYDIRITAYTLETAEKIKAFVKTLEGIDQTEYSNTADVSVVTGREIIAGQAVNSGVAVPATDGSMVVGLQMVGVTDEVFRTLCENTGIDPEPFFDQADPKGLLQNYISDYVSEGNKTVFMEYNPLKVSAGDSLSLVGPDGLIQDEETAQVIRKKNVPTRNMQVHTVLQTPVYTNSGGYGYPLLLFPQSVYDAGLPEGVQKKLIINLHTEKFEELDGIISQHIYELAGGDRSQIVYYNSAMNRQGQQQLMTVLNVFVYGFIALITLICISNIFNTITTGISQRRREFAMIKSVGMTPKGFRRMVSLESLFFGIKALLIGLPVSLAVHVAMWKVTASNFVLNLMTSIQWWAYGVAILAVFLIVSMALLYSVGKVRKNNIIETLKNEDS